MENKFFEYGKIKHFNDANKMIYAHLGREGKRESLKFHGTVKLHGTNFAIVYNIENDDIYYQKRTGILNLVGNFFDYQNVVIPVKEEIKEWLKKIYQGFYFGEYDSKFIIMYGELCGENIQKGVALEQLSKRFVAFDVYNDNGIRLPNELLNFWYPQEGIENIYNIEQFKTWDISLDIFDSAGMLEKRNIISQITLDVEKECPVAKHFGVSGIGEGVVWHNQYYDIKFKVKGDEHSNSKVKVLTGVSQDRIDSIRGISELCESICTENRYKQGIKYLEENNITDEKERKSKFVNWVVEDTIKEEIDTIVEKGFEIHKIKQNLYKNAIFYYMHQQ